MNLSPTLLVHISQNKQCLEAMGSHATIVIIDSFMVSTNIIEFVFIDVRMGESRVRNANTYHMGMYPVYMY